MILRIKRLTIPLLILAGSLNAVELDQYIELTDAAKSWVVHQGVPLYYTSLKAQYLVDSHDVSRMSIYDSRSDITLSPSADFRLITLLQELDEVKNGQRYADYSVLNDQNKLVYRVSRGTSADLKPLVAAISDKGTLALADPVNAKLYLYEKGELISEGQLYEDEGSVSMERNIQVEWVNNECYLLLERPGFNGAPGANVLFIRIDAAGRNQETSILPFTYLQAHVFAENHLFISGYNYRPDIQLMEPLIIEIDPHGSVLWNHESFGHELALSSNGRYLATLSSHESIKLFDLSAKRVHAVSYTHDNLISLGLTVNDGGDVAIIRVPVDFFVKRNTYFATIYFPQQKQGTEIQIDPRYPKLFQLYAQGDRFYIGTNYEWLEIRQ